MKLYIIGNGFDLYHGMKTNWNDYRKYLEKNTNIRTNFYESYFSPELYMPNFTWTEDCDWSRL